MRDGGDQRHFREPGPFEHHFYTLHIRIIKTHPVIFAYELDHELITAVLSLIYGKRVQTHGIISDMGIVSLPNLLTVVPNDYHRLPLYGGLRQDTPVVPCSWEALAEFTGLLSSLTYVVNDPLINAARSYADSLRLLPIDVEVAYFRLIQALESAAGSVEYSDDERFGHDSELMRHVKWLEEEHGDRGRKLAKFLKRRLYQVKRAVWLWVQAQIGDDFFTAGPGSLRRETLKSAISAAYALRSRYAHEGLRFGRWVMPKAGRESEPENIPEERLAVVDPDFRKVLSVAPSFAGLERIVRYGLIRAIRSRILDVK